MKKIILFLVFFSQIVFGQYNNPKATVVNGTDTVVIKQNGRLKIATVSQFPGGGGGGSSTLSGLTDVTVTSPANNQLLQYDFSTGKWKNQTPTNQTITFTPNSGGDVTGISSGSTSLIPNLIIGSGKITNSHLAGGIDLTTKVTGLLPDANILNASTWNGKERVFNIASYGAKGDFVNLQNAVMTSGSNILTSSTAIFTNNDIGKYIKVFGAGVSGATIITTISGFTNSTTITIAVSASTTVTGKWCDYGTENTPFIQNAINAAAISGGTVYFPNGIYLIGGALQTSVSGTNPNSQIYIPSQLLSSSLRSQIILKGESSNHFDDGYGGTGVAVIGKKSTGVILISTLPTNETSGLTPAVFGSIGQSANYQSLNYSDLIVENMLIRLCTNAGNSTPNLGGICGKNLSKFCTENVSIAIDIANNVSVDPTGSNSFGIIYGQVNNNGTNYARGGIVSGVEYGAVYPEHTDIQGQYFFCCKYAVCIPDNYYPIIGNVLVHGCVYAIYRQSGILGTSSYGATKAYINLEIEVERLTYSPVKWYTPVAEVLDVSNTLIGYLKYHIVTSGIGENNAALVITGASLLETETYTGFQNKKTLVDQVGLDGFRGFRNFQNVNSQSGSVNGLYKSRGTFVSPTNVTANDFVGLTSYNPYVGGAYNITAHTGAIMETSTTTGIYMTTGTMAGPSLLVSSNNFTAVGNFGAFGSVSVPKYQLDVIGSNPQIHLNTSISDNGGYLTGLANGLILHSDNIFNGTNYIAKGTTPASVLLTGDRIAFNINSAATIGGTYTPNELARITNIKNFLLGTSVTPTSLTGGFAIANGTLNTADISGGGIGLASVSGALKIRANGGITYSFGATSQIGSLTTAGVVTTDASGNLNSTSNIVINSISTTATTNTLVADQNNYAIGTATFFRLASTPARTITGLSGGTDGKILIVNNVGSGSLTFTNNDVLSTATNRFLISTGANLTIATNQTVTLIYDSGSGFWRDIALR